jgi:triphosphoribosyl-dephospho-CoA synthase CitG
MVNKAHTNKDLENYLDNLRSEFENHLNKKIKKTAKLIEVLAYESVLREVLTSPKPGLVDLMDNGSHDDMNLDTFIKSSKAIKPFFSKFFIIGAKNFNKKNKFKQLRSLGIKAEEKMFAATNGVNTQKGIIFSFALVIAALGELFISKCTDFDNISLAISKIVKEWTFGLVESELRTEVEKAVNDNKKSTSIKKLTHGQTCYLRYGITGARGEAKNGFENVLNYGLPVFKKYKRQGYPNNFASIQTLISLISEVDDTNIIYRSDITILRHIKNQFKELKKQGGILTFEGKKKYENLNKFMKSNSISPGGSADLLATTHLLYKIEENLEKIIYM